MSDDVLVRVEGVSKKFCHDLKRSLWYGVQDTIGDLLGRDGSAHELRPDEFWAVNDISFELHRGECLGLIGRNGAGKTTLLKMLNGLIKPDRGRIEMRGRVGALIALGAGFNPILTGRENVYVNGAVLGLGRKEIDAKYDEIISFADIGPFIDAPVQSYSSGMQVRLGFAIAVAVKPDVLLLDEVLAVGDPPFQAKCFNTLAKFRKEGTGFVFVSHSMHLISRYCEQALYLRNGEVAFQGDVDAAIGGFLRNADGTYDGGDSSDWSKAMGSGNIRFVGYRFLNASGDEISAINMGDPVTLAIKFERHDPRVKSAVLDLIIRDKDDEIFFQGTNEVCGCPFDEIGSHGEFRIHFEYLPANADYVNFSIALFGPSDTEVYDWKRNLRLRIKRQSFSLHGKSFLPTRWTVVETVGQ